MFSNVYSAAFPSIILGLSNNSIPKLTNGHAGILFPEPSFRALVVTAPAISLANLSGFYREQISFDTQGQIEDRDPYTLLKQGLSVDEEITGKNSRCQWKFLTMAQHHWRITRS